MSDPGNQSLRLVPLFTTPVLPDTSPRISGTFGVFRLRLVTDPVSFFVTYYDRPRVILLSGTYIFPTYAEVPI